MLLTSINLDKVRNSEAIKIFFKMAGYAGPWNKQTTTQLSIIEENDCTIITLAQEIPKLVNLLNPTLIEEKTSTVLVTNIQGDFPTLIFPLQQIKRSSIIGKNLKKNRVVMRTRGSGYCLAIAGEYQGYKTLTIGFSLSDFIERSRKQHYFFGYGHVLFVVKWFIESFANLSTVNISPWYQGKLPLILSFDVESNVPRRSLGKTIFGIPFFNINLIQINKIKLLKPIITKRLIKSTNTLNDQDGSFKSYRFLIDIRKSQQGLFADNIYVNQWQFHWLINKSKITNTDYHSFMKWSIFYVKKFTSFYCGLDRVKFIGDEEIGFHSFDHKHFNDLNRYQLKQKLSKAINSFFPLDYPRAIRAPGLLWSKNYFEVLGELGFNLDSSFKETNYLQPIFPMITDSGWWEIPVTGNIFNTPDLDKVISTVKFCGGILSLYAHDHDLTTPEKQQDYINIVASLVERGFRKTGLLEFLDWLVTSQNNEIEDICETANGRILIKARLVRNSSVTVTNLPHEIAGLDQNQWLFELDQKTTKMTYYGQDKRCVIEIIPDYEQ